MKKHGLLNSALAKLAADLGHTDLVCIADVGLPVPQGVAKIDLALSLGKPSFQELLDLYLENILVEKVYLAEEIRAQNSEQLAVSLAKLPPSVEVVYLTHDELKKLTKSTRAIIRTGEATPYSNIILQSGVII